MSDAAPLTVAEFLALHLRPSGPIWVLYDPPEPAPDDPTDVPIAGDAGRYTPRYMKRPGDVVSVPGLADREGST